MNGRVRRLTTISMFLALAVVLGYFESFIPSLVPGVKLGLANILVIVLIYQFSWYEALMVDVLRVVLVSLLRGSFLQMGFFMSLAGAIASYLVMLILIRLAKKLTVFGVSMAGAYVHCLAQVAVCAIYVESLSIFYYFALSSLLALLSGIVSGFVSNLLLSNRFTRFYKKA